MEKIKSKFDDIRQKIRPGTTWVSGFTQPGNNDDLRSIDVDGTEMRFIPASRYYASCTIKRGQALSIAQLQDLTEEQSKNKYAYVKITDPDLDETCIGIAMNYAEEGQIVHIQSTGKFNYSTTDSVLYSEEAAKKEIFLKADGWKYDQVRGQKLYIKKLYNNTTNVEEGNNFLRPSTAAGGGIPTDEFGDAFDTDHADTSVAADDSDWFTYDFADSVYNAKATIQIGTLTDAPTTNLFYYTRDEEGKWYQQVSEDQVVEVGNDVNKDIVIVEYDKEKQKIVTAEDFVLRFIDTEIPKGSTPPKANEALWLQLMKEDENGVKYYAAVDDLTATIELEITGDTRGPLDNTQFLLTLGETIYFDTKKQDVELFPPHYNEGIFDELKVLSIASGAASGPVFRLFLSTHGNAAYKKAESFVDGKEYYVRYPGNVYKKINRPTQETFENTFAVAENWYADVEYFELDRESKKYISKGELSLDEYNDFGDSLYYRLEYYEAADKLDYAFISVRKLDGDTCMVPVLCDFTEEELAGGAVLVDPNDEGYFRLSQQFTAGAKQEYYKPVEKDEDSSEEYYALDLETNEFVLAEDADENTQLFVKEVRSPKITIDEPVMELSRDSLQEAVIKALKKIFVSNKTRITGCTPVTYYIGDEGFHLSTEEVGGYYDIYVSSNLLHLITSTQVKHGQDADPGTAILADIRDADRLSVVGVALSNASGVHRAGEIIKVMRMGRITTLGNLLPGQDYYLGLNGRITARAQYWYDHQVPIGTAESENYFIVDVSQNPMRSYAGNLPLGYLKPSIYGMAEKGYVVADGKTVYNKDEYPELYNMLLDWFDVEELKPSNVSEDLYNKYENWSLSQIFTDIFGKFTQLDQDQAFLRELQNKNTKLLEDLQEAVDEVNNMRDELDKTLQDFKTDFESKLEAQNQLIRSEKLLRQISNGSATLTDSIAIEGEGIIITRSTTLDLNSFKLEATGTPTGHMIVVKPVASEAPINVTIKNGSLGHSEIDKDTSGVVYVAGNANVVLEDVDIDGGVDSNPVYLNDAEAVVTIKSGNYITKGNQAVYVQNGKKVRIEGGQYVATPWKDKYYTLNLKDSLVTPEKPAIETLEVVGGSFLEFNPAESYAEPNGPVSLVPRGYKVIKEVKIEQTKVLDEDTNEEVDSTIQHNWYTVVKMNSLETFKEDISYGGEVTLGSDLNIPGESLNITKDLILDLQGFTLSADGDSYGDVIKFIKADASDNKEIQVTIKNGTIKGSSATEGKDNGILMVKRPIHLTLENVTVDGGTGGAPVWVTSEEATVVINSGKYTTKDVEAIYVQNGKKVEIKGGEFEAAPYEGKYFTLNLKDSLLTNTDKKPIDYITVTGGSFAHFNPAESYAEPNAPVSFVPEDYKVVRAGDIFTVVEDDSKELGEQLKVDIKNGGTVKLTDNTFVTDTALEITTDTVLDLDGHTLITDGNEKGCAVVISQNSSVTIKNGTIKGSAIVDSKEGGIIYITGAASVTLEDVTIDGGKAADPIWIANEEAEVTINSGKYITNSVEAVYMQMGKKLYIKDGYFECQPYNDKYFTVNLKDSLVKDTGKVPLDFVEITGGTFKYFDPSNSMAEPNGPVTLVPKSCVVIADEGNNTFTVQNRGAELLEDLSKNSEVQLEGDTSIPGCTIELAQDTVIDLNNHSLTSDMSSYGDVLQFKATKAVKLTLKNGTIKADGAAGTDGGAIYVTGNVDLTLENVEIETETGLNPIYLNNANAKLTIKSGKYITKQGVQSIYVQKGDEITIKGGYFECQPYNSKYFTLNLKDNLVTADKQPDNYFKVKGGSFKGFDPSKTEAEPNGPHNLVVDGYKVVQDADVFTVIRDPARDLGDKLKEDIANGGDIELTGDAFVAGEELKIVKDTVLDLGGHTLTTDGNDKGHAVVISQAGTITIKNGTIKGSELVNEKEGGILLITGAADVTLENVTIDGGNESDPVWVANENATVTINSGKYTTNGVESVYVQAGKKVYIKDGYFECQPYNGKYYTINLLDALTKNTSQVPIDFVEITGGQFVNFDPSKSMAEPNAPVSYLPDGYEAIQEGDIYTVREKEEPDPEEEDTEEEPNTNPDDENDSGDNREDENSEDSSDDENEKEEDSGEGDSEDQEDDNVDKPESEDEDPNNSQDEDGDEEEDASEDNVEDTDESDDQNSEGESEIEDEESEEDESEEEKEKSEE